jgi:hypothetical protein
LGLYLLGCQALSFANIKKTGALHSASSFMKLRRWIMGCFIYFCLGISATVPQLAVVEDDGLVLHVKMLGAHDALLNV